jgi:hypothetical protein
MVDKVGPNPEQVFRVLLRQRAAWVNPGVDTQHLARREK